MYFLLWAQANVKQNKKEPKLMLKYMIHIEIFLNKNITFNVYYTKVFEFLELITTEN